MVLLVEITFWTQMIYEILYNESGSKFWNFRQYDIPGWQDEEINQV
jgi:hypothetical protein